MSLDSSHQAGDLIWLDMHPPAPQPNPRGLQLGELREFGDVDALVTQREAQVELDNLVQSESRRHHLSVARRTRLGPYPGVGRATQRLRD